MKIGVGLITLAGLLLALGLIAAQGFATVAEAIVVAEWGLLGVLLLHSVPLVLSSLAWKTLFQKAWRGPFRAYFLARWIREGVNDLLPVAQIGGHLAGARILSLYGAKGGAAGAGVIVDITLRLLAQLAFTLLGLWLLFNRTNQVGLAPGLLAGLSVALLALMGFILVQRWGLFRQLERLMMRLADKWDVPALGQVGDLHATIQLLYRRGWRIVTSGVLHVASLVIGTTEFWLLLYCMGHPVSLVDAIILESLAQAVRTMSFAVPGALGIQEGGYLVLGGMLGIGPEIALGVSIAKRVRDWAWGLPALSVWHLLEMNTLPTTVRQRNLASTPQSHPSPSRTS